MEIDTELFDFSESSNLRTNKAVVDTLNLILDFSTDHQIGPIVTYLAASLNDSKIPANPDLKKACYSRFVRYLDSWHYKEEPASHSIEIIDFFWKFLIPTEWKCGQDYFLFVQLVSYLVMHPLIKFENAEVLNANYNQISSNSYYKKKLTQETQDSIAKEFKQMLGLRKQKNSKASAIDQLKGKYSKLNLMIKFSSFYNYISEAIGSPSTLESLVGKSNIPHAKKTKIYEEEEEEEEEDDEEANEDADAQGTPAGKTSKQLKKDTQDGIATQLPSHYDSPRKLRSASKIANSQEKSEVATPKLLTPAKAKVATRSSPQNSPTKSSQNNKPSIPTKTTQNNKLSEENNKKRKKTDKDEEDVDDEPGKKKKKVAIEASSNDDDENIFGFQPDIDFENKPTHRIKIKEFRVASRNLHSMGDDPLPEAQDIFKDNLAEKKGEKIDDFDLESSESDSESSSKKKKKSAFEMSSPTNKNSKSIDSSMDTPQRIKFTDAEDEALLAGIKKYGKGKWKLILDGYSKKFHEKRTPVSLKDRYRQLCNSNIINRAGVRLNSPKPTKEATKDAAKDVEEHVVEEIEDSSAEK